MTLAYDVVVLAGGSARRFGGVDKSALVVGERTLLERVLAATLGAARVVVVGPVRDLAGGPAVRWTQEQPPGAGPVAGLQAGLAQVHAPVVVLLAADLPFVSVAVVAALAGAAAHPGAVQGGAVQGGAVLLDGDGRSQWLLSAWPADDLRAALVGAAPGASLRSVLGGLAWSGLLATDLVGQGPAEVWYDCDTFEELAEARRRERNRHDDRADVAELDD